MKRRRWDTRGMRGVGEGRDYACAITEKVITIFCDILTKVSRYSILLR